MFSVLSCLERLAAHNRKENQVYAKLQVNNLYRNFLSQDRSKDCLSCDLTSQ